MRAARTRAVACRSLAALLLAGASLAACATPQPRYSSRIEGPVSRPTPSSPAPSTSGGRYKVGSPYQVGGVWYVPREQPDYDETGVASWYGDAFHLQRTANGETFDMTGISAAHTTLPLPSIVEVTNLDNGRKLKVRVNDRGPFVGGRIIDLSRAAAQELGFDRQGLARVRVRYIGPASLEQPDTGLRYASNRAAPPRSSSPAPRAYSPPPATTYARADVPRATPAYAPPRSSSVAVFTSGPLPPVTGFAISPNGLKDFAAARQSSQPPQTGRAVQTAASGPIPIYRVQAGAFSDRDNARRVVARLGGSNAATIEPIERNGAMLYRVVLPGGPSEDQAWALRDRIASMGYDDARVLRPF